MVLNIGVTLTSCLLSSFEVLILWAVSDWIHILYQFVCFRIKGISGIILPIGSANERRRCIAMSHLIGWAHTQNGHRFLALVRSYVDCLLVIWRTLEIIISTNYPHTKIPHLLSLFGCSSTSLFQSVLEFICYVQPGTVCWKIRPYGRQGLSCLT